MLIIDIKPGENIDRALKRYKQKVRKTKQIQNIRANQFFTKKSQERREEIAKARYKDEYERSKEI
ncbi:30S ribosomal protein S21 [Mangrovimonas aestuarii]|uniref:30S ribosomal protein S21 n=1 Tax=Mangrovimonas aestuarii TaxID=3018443 RepID=UPI0023780E1E|nr:30S ribosomal protein S21 [Mangrovimonas aestuarii]